MLGGCHKSMKVLRQLHVQCLPRPSPHHVVAVDEAAGVALPVHHTEVNGVAGLGNVRRRQQRGVGRGVAGLVAADGGGSALRGALLAQQLLHRHWHRPGICGAGRRSGRGVGGHPATVRSARVTAVQAHAQQPGWQRAPSPALAANTSANASRTLSTALCSQSGPPTGSCPAASCSSASSRLSPTRAATPCVGGGVSHTLTSLQRAGTAQHHTTLACGTSPSRCTAAASLSSGAQCTSQTCVAPSRTPESLVTPSTWRRVCFTMHVLPCRSSQGCHLWTPASHL